MIVIATAEEINRVLQAIRPGFPHQNLAPLFSRRCFYVLDGVPVDIFLRDGDPPEDPPA